MNKLWKRPETVFQLQHSSSCVFAVTHIASATHGLIMTAAGC